MDGEAPVDLIAEGFKKATVYRLNSRLQSGELQPLVEKGLGRQARYPKDISATVVRITQEEIVLPGSIFILYHWVKARHPKYEATMAQWLMDVVQCWAEDHAEELGINPMMWAQSFEPEVQEKGEEEDSGAFWTSLLDWKG